MDRYGIYIFLSNLSNRYIYSSLAIVSISNTIFLLLFFPLSPTNTDSSSISHHCAIWKLPIFVWRMRSRPPAQYTCFHTIEHFTTEHYSRLCVYPHTKKKGNKVLADLFCSDCLSDERYSAHANRFFFVYII